MKTHYEVLIIGGGTAGIMTAGQLLKEDPKADIAIIEPAETHYYQPAWTLVGAGTYDFNKTAKPMASVMPAGVDWIKDYATGMNPEMNSVSTKNSGSINYDYLVVAPGLIMDPSMIEGLPEALEQGIACSNYIDPEFTWETIKNFKGGNAVFTQPTTPIKCGGAPQKIAYLAADYFRKKKMSDDVNVIFATPGSVIFGVKPIRDTLMKVIDRYGIHFRPFYAPFRIDVKEKVIHFNHTASEENRCIINEDNEISEVMGGDADISIPFDMLHIAPPQRSPDFVRDSVLSNEAGWVDVDIHSMQHVKFRNVFALGDVAALPTAKTGAAVRKQVPVVVDNLLKLRANQEATNADYHGYSSCPLVTGYGKMVLAEFNYNGEFTPDPKLKRMLIFNSAKEHWRLWYLKKYLLPKLYWTKMMKGKRV